MSARPDPRTQVALLAVVAAGVAIRLVYVAAPGFPTDVGTFAAWGERLAAIGPGRFYEPGYFSDYPPAFLYVLWAMGALFDGEALRLAVKAVSIPFDVAIAVAASLLAWRAGGRGPAVLAAGLWLLAPGIVFAGTYWGQVDAVGTAVFMGALLAAGGRRWALAGALAALAALVKPQLGLGLILVLAAAAIEWVRFARWRPAVLAAGTAALVILALGLPFRAGPGELVALVRAASETYPFTSLYAFNPWSAVADFWMPDDGYVVIGGILLAAGIAGACVPLWWRRDTTTLLICGALASLAFYFLPTRAHERYLFPALAVLVPFAALRTRLLVPYVALSAAFFLTLVYVFLRYRLVEVPAALDATLFTRPGQIALALAMTGLAAFIAWRLLAGDVSLEPAARRPRPAPAAGVAAPAAPIPAGLASGRSPTRRDILIALAVAIVVLGTRGYRLDHPRDMYFDEVYHARTAFELIAQREVYEWTHPHLAKQLMALGILAFGNDRVVGREPVPEGMRALAVDNDGTRVFATADRRIVLRERGGAERAVGTAPDDVVALAIERGRVVALTTSRLLAFPPGQSAPETRALGAAGAPTSLALAGARVVVGTRAGTAIHTDGRDPLLVATPAVALAAKPDGSELYVLDPQGTVHVVDPATGAATRTLGAGAPGGAIAYAQGPQRVFVARAAEPSIDVYDLEGGGRERVELQNARTGEVRSAATALAVVPRTQFLYALAGSRLIVVETHGSSPYTAIPVAGAMLAVDGTADHLVVAGAGGAELVETGRHALAWRLPGVAAGALLAFFVVLLARRLFASPHAPLFAGALVIVESSMFAQARIGMNDIYVAAFLVAAWYFVVAAHAPRRSAALDLLIAGGFFGLAAASKWVAVYALAALAIASLAVTARAYAQERRGTGGPLDLLARRGLNAGFLLLCFAAIPAGIYALAYAPWFGGPTVPYGWDLRELTQQMYWYHSRLTAPHPAGSPWWSWPLVLKPVYWYFGASEGGGSAVIYDAGNIVVFWGALGATVWCAIAAVRTRSVTLGFVVFALAAQLVAWIPITRVVFFYHFFTALPFYLLALTAGLVALWGAGRRAPVQAYLALAAAAFVFFYPFVSGQPVPAQQSAIFFILPTWQYDCRFYPEFVCAAAAAAPLDPATVVSRMAGAGAVAGLAIAAWLAVERLPLRARGTTRGPGPLPPRR